LSPELCINLAIGWDIRRYQNTDIRSRYQTTDIRSNQWDAQNISYCLIRHTADSNRASIRKGKRGSGKTRTNFLAGPVATAQGVMVLN